MLLLHEANITPLSLVWGILRPRMIKNVSRLYLNIYNYNISSFLFHPTKLFRTVAMLLHSIFLQNSSVE